MFVFVDTSDAQVKNNNMYNVVSDWPESTRLLGALSKDLMSGSREIYVHNITITLKFDRHRGSIAAGICVYSQNDIKASMCEILWQHV